MSENTPNVDNPESTSEVQETPQFSSIEDAFAAARQSRSGQVEETVSEPEAEAEETETEEPESTETEEVEAVAETEEEVGDTEESEAEETEEEAEEPDVLSQVEGIDFDTLPQEVQDAIAEKLEVRSHTAFAEQRTKIKALESELNQLRDAKATEVVEAVSGTNAFSNVTDVAELEKQVSQAQTNVDYFTEALLEKQTTQYNEQSGEEVAGIEHDGKFYDKNFILNYIKQQKAAVTEGKSREKQLKSFAELQKGQNEIVAQSKTKLGITADSEASKEYDAFLENPNFQTVLRAMPDYAKELIEVFGQAAVAKVGSQGGKILIPKKGPKGKVKSVTPSNKATSAPKQNSNSAKLAALTKQLKKGVSSKEEALKLARKARQLKS